MDSTRERSGGDPEYSGVEMDKWGVEMDKWGNCIATGGHAGKGETRILQRGGVCF